MKWTSAGDGVDTMDVSDVDGGNTQSFEQTSGGCRDGGSVNMEDGRTGGADKYEDCGGSTLVLGIQRTFALEQTQPLP